MKNKLIPTLLLLVLHAPLLKAQNNINLNSLPPVNDLMTVVSNPGADTVILCSHGGPTATLQLTDFTFYQAIPTFSTVYVKQYQHYNPDIANDTNLTLAQAVVCNDTGVAILRKVVNHFNSQGKVVVITGHSFGAFLIPEYLDDYGNSDIHRVIPMAGRLNMNDTIWNAFATGYFASFNPSDGMTPVVNTTQEPSTLWAFMKLMAGYGYNRHIDSLAGLNLNNLMYLYGEHDEAVGRLLPDETSFLTSRNATVIAVPGGDHGSMFANSYMNQALTFIRNNSVVSVDDIDKNPFTLAPTVVRNNMRLNLTKEGQLLIYGTTGQIILRKKCTLSTNYINCNNLPNGLYIAVYTTNDNKRYTQKIIKQ